MELLHFSGHPCLRDSRGTGVQTAEGEQKPSVNITWYGRKAQVWTSAVQCTPVPMYFNVIYLVWVVLVVFFYYYFCSEGVKATKMLMSSVCSSKKCCLIDRATPGTKAVTVQHISTTWNASSSHSYPAYFSISVFSQPKFLSVRTPLFSKCQVSPYSTTANLSPSP